MYRKVSVIAAEIDAVNEQLDAATSADVIDSTPAEDIVALNAKVKELVAEKEAAKKYESALQDIQARKTSPANIQPPVEPEPVSVKNTLPAVAKTQKSKHFSENVDAYVAGMYFSHLAGNQKAGEILAAQSVGTDAKGGFTVPDPLANTLINLLEARGVARAVCKRVVMGALTWTVPKLTAHATVYYPAEAAAITASDLTFAQITLTAKKIAALVKMSTEISEDSVISMVDSIVESIAYSVAQAEDDNLFNGVASAINADGIDNDTDVADVNVASVAAMTLADLTAATVAIGNPIRGAVNEWYMNPTLFHGPIRDLLNAAGGNTMRELEEAQRPMLLGYPVNFVSVMPGSAAVGVGNLLAVFGDMSLGCYFGDRRDWSFKVLNELYAETDQVGIIGTERIDIQVANPEVLSKVTITG